MHRRTHNTRTALKLSAILAFSLSLAVLTPACGLLGGGAGFLSGLPGVGFITGLPGFGLINGLTSGPLGFVLSILPNLLQPPPLPFENELNAPSNATANAKFITDNALPAPITPLVLGPLDSEPSFGTLGPDNRIYYTEKYTGRIRIFDPATNLVLPGFVLDLAVNNSGSRGLVGIAFSTAGNRLYVTYTTSTTSGDSTTEAEGGEARLSAFPFAAGAVTGAEQVLWSTTARDSQFPSDINGIGPCIVAPDGFLYFSHGDRNSRLTALDILGSEASGKIFRLNQDGTTPSGPIEGQPTFAVGIRSCTGMAVDPANGLFWFLDDNPGVSDELNLLAPGLTYGWPASQGNANTDFEGFVAQLGLFSYHDPIIDFGSTENDPRGIVVNRNGPYGAGMEGDVFFGAARSVPSAVWRYRITADFIIQRTRVFEVPATGGRVRDLVKGPDGRIYVFCVNEVFVLNPGM